MLSEYINIYTILYKSVYMLCSVCKITEDFPSANRKMCASDVTKLTKLHCMPFMFHVAQVWCAEVQTRFMCQHGSLANKK